MLIAITVAFFSGVARTIGRVANAQLSERIGPLQSTFYNYLLGLACSALALLGGGEAIGDFAGGGLHIPLWAYFGGVVGVLFVVLSNLTAPNISAFSMTLLMFVGQIATGVVIDLFAHQQLSLGKIAGAALILAGLLGNQALDKRGREGTRKLAL